jgi:hypothetical protein
MDRTEVCHAQLVSCDRRHETPTEGQGRSVLVVVYLSGTMRMLRNEHSSAQQIHAIGTAKG